MGCCSPADSCGRRWRRRAISRAPAGRGRRRPSSRLVPGLEAWRPHPPGTSPPPLSPSSAKPTASGAEALAGSGGVAVWPVCAQPEEGQAADRNLRKKSLPMPTECPSPGPNHQAPVTALKPRTWATHPESFDLLVIAPPTRRHHRPGRAPRPLVVLVEAVTSPRANQQPQQQVLHGACAIWSWPSKPFDRASCQLVPRSSGERGHWLQPCACLSSWSLLLPTRKPRWATAYYGAGLRSYRLLAAARISATAPLAPGVSRQMPELALATAASLRDALRDARLNLLIRPQRRPAGADVHTAAPL